MALAVAERTCSRPAAPHDRLGADLLPAPGRFSMTNGWPSRSDKPLTDQARDDVVAAAGGKRNDQRTGRDG